MGSARRIVITGGTRGLGRALAAEFLARDQRVFITGRSAESVGRALAELRAAGGGDRVGGTAADLGSFEELRRAAAEAAAFLGGIDHWIGNAGVNQAWGPLLDLPAAELDRVLRTDLLGPMYGGLAVRAELEESGGFLWFMEGHGSERPRGSRRIEVTNLSRPPFSATDARRKRERPERFDSGTRSAIRSCRSHPRA